MNITAHRHIWFTISGILILASLASLIFIGPKLGLDFTGGARWDIKFESQNPSPEISENEKLEASESEMVTTEKLESFFAAQEGLTQAPQIQASEDQTFLITLQDLPDAALQSISENMATEVGTFEVISYRKVDATIGQSFKTKSLYAILTALIGIILFVAFAFRRIPEAINPWRFGGVAIIALFHDILIVFGVFVLLGHFTGLELDLPFVTALLATLGFSVNDTIVVLDRVRENVRLQKAHETFEDTIENSIQQTLLRSLNTSVSTLLPLLGLLFFGAESIFYFVLALTLGIAIGTYSSIFLAAPMLAEWKKLADKRG